MGWYAKPSIMVCYFDFFGHLFMIFRDFSLFQVFFMHLDAFRCSRNTGEQWGDGLACPALHNSMLFRCFYNFSLILGVFQAFGCIWKLKRCRRLLGGRAGMSNPLQWYVNSIFHSFFAYFSCFFAISCVSHAFR